jgi:hypothetical protein
MGYSEKHCPVSVTLCRYSGFNSTKEEEEEAEGLEEGGGGLNLFILGTNERKFIGATGPEEDVFIPPNPSSSWYKRSLCHNNLTSIIPMNKGVAITLTNEKAYTMKINKRNEI